ncbi:hypothetical protein HY988_02050 [Candidatus Micrarchaeota archaeon]|nr:hypothetical protein [Candidatus Micrarchaeota archaeon]
MSFYTNPITYSALGPLRPNVTLISSNDNRLRREHASDFRSRLSGFDRLVFADKRSNALLTAQIHSSSLNAHAIAAFTRAKYYLGDDFSHTVLLEQMSIPPNTFVTLMCLKNLYGAASLFHPADQRLLEVVSAILDSVIEDTDLAPLINKGRIFNHLFRILELFRLNPKMIGLADLSINALFYRSCDLKFYVPKIAELADKSTALKLGVIVDSSSHPHIKSAFDSEPADLPADFGTFIDRLQLLRATPLADIIRQLMIAVDPLPAEELRRIA